MYCPWTRLNSIRTRTTPMSTPGSQRADCSESSLTRPDHGSMEANPWASLSKASLCQKLLKAKRWEPREVYPLTLYNVGLWAQERGGGSAPLLSHLPPGSTCCQERCGGILAISAVSPVCQADSSLGPCPLRLSLPSGQSRQEARQLRGTTSSVRIKGCRRPEGCFF